MPELSARSIALRRGIRLEALTIAWMAVEAVLAIGAGIAARSVLLAAFGTDSVIELVSALTLFWRLSSEQRRNRVERVDAAERTATRISAVLLGLLSVFVLLSSIAGLVFRVEPERSWLGLAVAAAAVIAMPWLALQKGKVNATLQSPALRADIAESATCAYLAGVTLLGLAVSAITGWWWVEYVAAIVLLRWLIPEAREAFDAARGQKET